MMTLTHGAGETPLQIVDVVHASESDPNLWFVRFRTHGKADLKQWLIRDAADELDASVRFYARARKVYGPAGATIHGE